MRSEPPYWQDRHKPVISTTGHAVSTFGTTLLTRPALACCLNHRPCCQYVRNRPADKTGTSLLSQPPAILSVLSEPPCWQDRHLQFYVEKNKTIDHVSEYRSIQQTFQAEKCVIKYQLQEGLDQSCIGLIPVGCEKYLGKLAPPLLVWWGSSIWTGW
jgi:hypothetical protein